MTSTGAGDAQGSHGSSDEFEPYRPSPESLSETPSVVVIDVKDDPPPKPPPGPAPGPTPGPAPAPAPCDPDTDGAGVNVPRTGMASNIVLKADGSNYLAWSYILPSVLGTSAYCWEVTNSELTYPNAETLKTPAGKLRAKHFEIGNRAGRYILFSAISPTLIMAEFAHNSSTIEAPEIWRRLKNKFTSTNGGLKEMIMMKFMTYKFAQNKSAAENLAAFDQIINQGTLLAVTYPDDLKVVRLLDSLSSGWEAFRQSWTARVSDSKSLAQLKDAIAMESLRRGKETTDISALFSRLNTNSRSNQRRVTRRTRRRSITRSTTITCYNCGRRGHKRSECRSPPSQNNQNNAQSSSSGPSGSSGSSTPANRYNLRPRQNRNGNNRGGRQPPRGRSQPQANHVEALIVEAGSPEINLVSNNNEFIVDSGTTHHMVNNKNWIIDYHPFVKHQSVKLGGARTLNAQGSGTAYIPVQQQGERVILKLNDVLYVPRLRRNLVSVSKLTDDGYQVIVNNNAIDLVSGKNKIKAVRENALYTFQASSNIEGNTATSDKGVVSLKEVHEAFAHVGVQALKKMLAREGFIVKNDLDQCEACVRGKMHRSSYRSKPASARANRPGYIHSDVCSVTPHSYGGAKHFLTLTDDYSSYRKVYCLRSKDQVPDCI